MSECFYCHLPIAANDEVVHGVAVVAHRDCVQRRKVACLRTVWPEFPTSVPARWMVLRSLGEAGVTAEELWG
jgi:hypothetical protein